MKKLVVFGLAMLFAGSVAAQSFGDDLNSVSEPETFENPIDTCSGTCTTSDTVMISIDNGEASMDTGDTGYCGRAGVRISSEVPDDADSLRFDSSRTKDYYGHPAGLRINGEWAIQFNADGSSDWISREHEVDMSRYRGEEVNMSFVVQDFSEEYCDMFDHAQSFSVTDLEYVTQEKPDQVTVCDSCEPARDPDDDGDYEDVNGDGAVDVEDVELLDDKEAQGRDLLSEEFTPFFDFNDDGDLDFLDVTVLSRDVDVPEPVCDDCSSPQDPDQDGQYEDVNGDGETGFEDVRVFLENIDSIDSGSHSNFDFGGSLHGRSLGTGDLSALHEEVAQEPGEGVVVRLGASSLSECGLIRDTGEPCLSPGEFDGENLLYINRGVGKEAFYVEEGDELLIDEGVISIENIASSEDGSNYLVEFSAEERKTDFITYTIIHRSEGSETTIRVKASDNSPDRNIWVYPLDAEAGFQAWREELKFEEETARVSRELPPGEYRVEVQQIVGGGYQYEGPIIAQKDITVETDEPVENLDARITSSWVPEEVVSRKDYDAYVSVENPAQANFEGQINVVFQMPGGRQFTATENIEMGPESNRNFTVDFDVDSPTGGGIPAGTKYTVSPELLASTGDGPYGKPGYRKISEGDNSEMTVVEETSDEDVKAVNLSLNDGWNMISSASVDSNSATRIELSQLESKCEVQSYEGRNFWRYEEGEWKHPDSVTSSEGVYVSLSEDCEAEVQVEDTAHDRVLEATGEGWNMVSVPREIRLSSFSGTCEFESQSIWDYSENGWQSVEFDSTLDPEKGYFVRVSEPCRLGQSGSASAPPTPTGEFIDSVERWVR
jgi:hypothetical protein